MNALHVKLPRGRHARSPFCYSCHKRPRVNGQGYCASCRNAHERDRKRRVSEELAAYRETYARKRGGAR